MDEQQDVQAGSPLDDQTELQNEILAKIKTHNQKGKSNRMAEVQDARDQRLYFRGIQQFYWSEDRQDVVFEDEDDSPYDRTFDIVQGYGKIFISTFLGAKAKARAEADDPFNPASIRAASQAKKWERVYQKYNPTPKQQLEIGRLLFTDGRVITETTDKNGKTMTDFWGMLESRIPSNVPVDEEVPLKNCSLIQLEKEYPLNQMKRQYPDARKKINSGAGDTYERNARMAVMRKAGSDTAIDVLSGEDSYGLGTKTRSILRPDFYEEFQESTRVQLEEMFPQGFCIVHNGDTYLESYEYDPDAHLDVIHALPGDGMSRPSINSPLMPVQDSVNTGMNLIEETFDHGIPTTYYDETTNIDGLNKQREMPGASRKMTRKQNEPASDHFFQTQAVNPSAQQMEYMELLRGPYAQFVSGQQPALFGGQMEDQKTASGYAQARQMALGQMAIVWVPYTQWNAREKTRAVKLDSQRTDEIVANVPPASPGGKPESVRLQPGELQGASFTNESDENFPETYTERKNTLMNVLQAAGPLGDELLQEPDNLYLLKEMWGLDDLVIPGEDVRNNVLSDISQMEHEIPVPDPAQMPQQMLPPVGAQPPQVPLVSSIQIDTDYLDERDLAIGYKEVKRWINSPEGREAKVNNPAWFQNVSLYGLQYKKAMPPPEPPPAKPMGITANWKDLPPDAQVAALASDQIQVNPATIGVNKQVPRSASATN